MLLSTFRKGKFDISVYDKLTPELEIFLDNNQGNLKSAYLKLIEDTAQKDLVFRYVVAYDYQNKIQAFFYFQLLSFSSKNVSLKENFFLQILSKLVLSIRPFRLLISGNLFAVNFPAIKIENEKLTITDIIELIIETDKTLKSDVLILKDLDDTYTSSEMFLHGFEKYESDLTMSMNIDKKWKNIDDYLKELKKKYRKRAENILHAGSTLIRKELQAEEINAQSKEIYRLFQNVSNRQVIRMGQVISNYFYEYKKRFPDQFTFIGFYNNNKLVAFVTYVDHKEILEVHYIGIDYNLNPSMKLYFNILLDALETGIKIGKDQLELGRTAREAKANLGALPVYFNDYIRYNTTIASRLCRFIAKQFQLTMGEPWTYRSPFQINKKLQ